MNTKGKHILRNAILIFAISVVAGIALGLISWYFFEISTGGAASISGIGIGLLNAIGMIGFFAGIGASEKKLEGAK